MANVEQYFHTKLAVEVAWLYINVYDRYIKFNSVDNLHIQMTLMTWSVQIYEFQST